MIRGSFKVTYFLINILNHPIFSAKKDFFYSHLSNQTHTVNLQGLSNFRGILPGLKSDEKA